MKSVVLSTPEHNLRLCFVEFMTKFYEGGGKEYSPFKLKARTGGLIASKV